MQRKLVELNKKDLKRTKEIEELIKKDINKTKEIEELKEKDLKRTKEIEQLKKKEMNKSKEIEELKKKDFKKTKEIEELKKDAKKTMEIEKLKKEKNKMIHLKLHRGLEQHITISPNNRVHFIGNWSSVAAPDVLVRKGCKVVYEVKAKKSGVGVVFVGWADAGFTPHDNGGEWVGRCGHSWCFNFSFRSFNHYGFKCHNNRLVCKPWGKNCEHDGPDQVLGVALDMVSGQMLYGWDGVWDAPMGVTFNVDTHLLLFPAISGYAVNVQVNFGDKPLSFGGPDHSFKTLVQM